MRLRASLFERYPFGWLALASAIAGIVFVRCFPSEPHQPDSWAFEALARSLLAGRGLTYREPMLPGLDLYAFRAPGYPIFAALGLLFGGVGTVILIQGALCGLSASIVGRIAGQLGGARAAWAAFALRLVWPVAWQYARLEMSETLFEFLGITATWLALLCVERRRVGWALVAGVVAAASMLTRPAGAGTVAAIAAWLAWRHRRGAIAFALAALLVWLPWPIRNYARLHAFVPFSTLGGATTWAGTQPGEIVGPAFEWMSQHTDLGEVALDRHYFALARAEVRSRPWQAAMRMVRWSLLYLGPLRGRDPTLWVQRFAMLAALAAVLLAESRARLALPAMVWAAQGLLLVSVVLIDRYRFPTDWCVIVAAGVGLAGLADRLGTRRAAALAGVSLALCLAGSLLVARH